jgi:hypothetical protein
LAKGYDTFNEHDPSAVEEFKQSWRNLLEAKNFSETSAPG